jgi:hypothetical protein
MGLDITRSGYKSVLSKYTDLNEPDSSEQLCLKA